MSFRQSVDGMDTMSETEGAVVEANIAVVEAEQTQLPQRFVDPAPETVVGTNRETLLDENLDGYAFEMYDEMQNNIDRREPVFSDVLADLPGPSNNIRLAKEYCPILPNMKLVSECSAPLFCYCRCDLDSLAIGSSSLVGLVHRLSPDNSTFEIQTKLDRLDVDKGSRFEIQLLKQRDLVIEHGFVREQFRPKNRKGASEAGTSRLHHYKNISMGLFKISSPCK